MHREKIIVQPAAKGERIDIYLAEKTGISRSQIQKLIKRSDILVNEHGVYQHYRVKIGDVITIMFPPERTEELAPEQIPLDVLHQDRYLVVVNKPAGMVVYPAAGHAQGTLMNAIAYFCNQRTSVGAPHRPGVVHRLDKDTSGVMVVALEDTTYYNLAEQFRARSVNRRYSALVSGDVKENEGRIASKIGRSVSDRKKMSTSSKRGKEAVTRWKVMRRFGFATLISVKLETGRTHQIRVHFASIGHPVLGDKTYGKKIALEIKGRSKIIFPRQMLHAEMLGFVHPATGQYMEFSSPLPQDMIASLEEIQAMSGRN